MTGPPLDFLSDRARDIFRVVVESYLGTGAPVGSRTISRLPGLNLSPASIRNVMQDLEEAGLLAAPHTSAGRMPTETGLRLFVDAMMQADEPHDDDKRAIERELSGEGPIENALNTATALLSGLSACAGLVMVPRREAVVKQFSFAWLSGTQALAVLVGTDGSVENRVVDLPPGTTPSMLIEAANFLSAHASGRTLGEAQQWLAQQIADGEHALDEAAANLIARGLAAWSRDSEDRPVLLVRGQANLIDAHATADLERVRQLLDELEGKSEIARLLDSARAGAATRIFIGSENKLFSLSGSSVIAAPYRGPGGRVIGVVGVIGPTRLNYARVVPMVDFTAQTLSRLMQ
ncbi:heat-inducible transcription repressor HrcA [Sphingobium sp. SYK-6]|uniref:heat-inducible transcriptional repressor HrcA n=1 Tax=Sphingobium sp. (strain NBRC 103272 / SYK-6) TaxID=627192 RepID=UPI00022766CC|nr:heat-inducible transcriptional repressor HrcA [Sphingobium sp. SYK-6]BAK65180.1 heat-inducible transcription repressor HrcA [Sphingobium sp. SYK-6]